MSELLSAQTAERQEIAPGIIVASLEQPAPYRLNPESRQYGTVSQDTLLRNNERLLYGVFDGAGGVGQRPDLASQTAARAFDDYFSRPHVIAEMESNSLTPELAISHMKRAMYAANYAVSDQASGSITTAAVLKIVTIAGRRQALIANAGDSQILMYPPPERSFAEKQAIAASSGRPALEYALTTEQGINDDKRSMITNWVGHAKSGNPAHENEFKLIPLEDSSRILILSDGIGGSRDGEYMTQGVLLKAFVQPTPDQTVSWLMEASKKNDDKSVIAIDVHRAGVESGGSAALESEPKTLLDALRKGSELNDIRLSAYEKLNQLRDAYLEREAGHARRAIHLRRQHSKGGVESARKEYLAWRDEILAFEVTILQAQPEAPETPEMMELSKQATIVALFNEERLLAQEMLKRRLVATGNYRFVDVKGAREVEKLTKKGVGGQLNKFYEWFGSVNVGGTWHSKGALKKGAVMAGAGVVLGAAGALIAPAVGLASVGAAGIGGIAAANRITKAYMSTHIRKRSEEFNDQHAVARRDEVLAKLGNGTSGVGMLELLKTQTDTEVFRNRRRLALVAGSVVLGSMLGAGLAYLAEYVDIDFPNEKPEGGKTPSKPEGTKPTPPPVKPEHAPQNNGEIAGFKQKVTVEPGNGWTYEIQDSFAEKGINLDAQETLQMYDHLDKKFPGMHGNFFTSGSVYELPDGRTGIGSPGNFRWNPRVLEEMQRYYEEQQTKDKFTLAA